jgi:hypothetical protein
MKLVDTHEKFENPTRNKKLSISSQIINPVSASKLLEIRPTDSNDYYCPQADNFMMQNSSKQHEDLYIREIKNSRYLDNKDKNNSRCSNIQ